MIPQGHLNSNTVTLFIDALLLIVPKDTPHGLRCSVVLLDSLLSEGVVVNTSTAAASIRDCVQLIRSRLEELGEVW
jgi:hypothetical protein